MEASTDQARSRRVALVTGGATGIGAAITAELASSGYRVYVVQQNLDQVLRGREHFAGHPWFGQLEIGAFDLASGPECAAAVAACVARFGTLDVLVNNAGLSGAAASRELSQADDEHIDAVIDVNLKAPLRLARAALPYLLASDAGVIVNISSVAALAAQPDGAAYVASKAGLSGLTRSLACDLAADGIRVVAIAPGDVATATSRDPRLASAGTHPSWAKDRAPVGYPAEPADIAHAVSWVISPLARYVTGTTIVVDGALTAY
jgi:NAD(P)-dependent dehydrogenase (short-subunit alcohol dehydrogenase family)